ncbi:MAG TPA: hypothetical protein ENF48_04235 [Desulfobacteraceae bacterium]|nr:MAG: hypothetical protein DRH76_08455 [Deltaproteobacteria bacterium]HDI59558.1 hypothetical protein [Desulfobacteraceae bacterium]
MKRILFPAGITTLTLAILLWVAGPAAAQQPSWKGNGQKSKAAQKADCSGPQGPGVESREYQHRQEQQHRHQADRRDGRGDRYHRFFANRDRSPIDRYYANQFRRGHCPPGLAKKGNGCMPPGQAKKWKLYHPLPRDVIFYDLPREVLVHLGPPPSGHRFVRVAGDILLIAVGTGMVVDAIEDLGRIY